MLAQAFHSFSQNAMGPTATVALHASILLFIVAAIIGIAALLQPRRLKMVWADWAGGAGTLALGVYFIARFIEAGTEPLSNLFEVVALSALFLAFAYFVAIRVRKMPALGAFAFPALSIIFLVNLLFAGSTAGSADPTETRPLLVLHVVLVLLSYAAFFMATVAAIMFLLQERALKKHRDPAVIRNFPPLESLRRLVNTCILIGLPLLTLGLALGFVAMSSQGWAEIARNPKIPPSLVLWAVMAGVAGGRWSGLLHGRRHFYLVLVGFLLVLTTYVGLGVWSRSQSSAMVSAAALEVPCSAM
jgi:ABC-type uncharacterized transport system permease subunit